jgi:hypothetical protein
MSHVHKPSSDVRYLAQGPRGRTIVEQTNGYTVIRQMPIEADGRVRYRIKNQVGKTGRVVTEEGLWGAFGAPVSQMKNDGTVLSLSQKQIAARCVSRPFVV